MAFVMKSNLPAMKCFGVIGVLCSSFEFGPGMSAAALDFSVTLRGAYEAPPNSSSALGVGSVTLSGNLLWYYVEADLPPFGGGIFGPAGASATGELILKFTNYGFVPPWPAPGGQVVYGGYLQLTDKQLEDLNAGLWYINLTSSNYPAGELRGQICPLTPDGDCDNDGIPNAQDVCPSTPPGFAVDVAGCSIDQLVPCNGPWRDHKEYIKSFRETAMRFWKEGRITVARRNALIKQADESDCAPPPPPPPCDRHSGPVSIANETFWLHNGGIITTFADATYQATLSGIVQTGEYMWTPEGTTQFVVLIPDDGSAESTLKLLVTDIFGCYDRAGTYGILETGQSGAYTVTWYETP
jgi:hypothetical protein